MIVCADEGFKKKNALSDREKKIRPDTFKDAFCQAVYITCLKRGHNLKLKVSSCIVKYPKTQILFLKNILDLSYKI